MMVIIGFDHTTGVNIEQKCKEYEVFNKGDILSSQIVEGSNF